MKVVLYTINCPKCMVLEKKLKAKNIDFTIISNADEVINYGKAHNINGAPILEVDGAAMDFNAANQWINGR